jgi:hypothetical protein
MEDWAWVVAIPFVLLVVVSGIAVILSEMRYTRRRNAEIHDKCQACREDIPVLLVHNRNWDGLCYDHRQQWSRIRRLEKEMDET